MELDIDAVDLRDVVRGVAQSMEPILETKSQSIFLDQNDEIIDVDGDKSRLDQVVTNLVSNASKYSPDNSEIRLSVSADDESCIIEVADKGIGISVEDQEKLFTPFFRSDNPETRQVSGTGLGLVICKQIIELHGGTMIVRSSRGRGTTVRVELPIAPQGSRSAVAA
jgi:signal transduction histidine kinase